MASRMRPSDEINSEYMRSAPSRLHTARNGGSLTSSMGASKSGNSPSSISPIFTILILPVRIYSDKTDKCPVNLRKFSTAKDDGLYTEGVALRTTGDITRAFIGLLFSLRRDHAGHVPGYQRGYTLLKAQDPEVMAIPSVASAVRIAQFLYTFVVFLVPGALFALAMGKPAQYGAEQGFPCCR